MRAYHGTVGLVTIPNRTPKGRSGVTRRERIVVQLRPSCQARSLCQLPVPMETARSNAERFTTKQGHEGQPPSETPRGGLAPPCPAHGMDNRRFSERAERESGRETAVLDAAADDGPMTKGRLAPAPRAPKIRGMLIFTCALAILADVYV
jgi:hypothetical protein